MPITNVLTIGERESYSGGYRYSALINDVVVGVIHSEEFGFGGREGSSASFTPAAEGAKRGLVTQSGDGMWGIMVKVADQAKAVVVDAKGRVSYDLSQRVGWQMKIAGLDRVYVYFQDVGGRGPFFGPEIGAKRTVFLTKKQAQACAKQASKSLRTKVVVEPAKAFMDRKSGVRPTYRLKIGDRIRISEELFARARQLIEGPGNGPTALPDFIAAKTKGLITAEVVGVRCAFGSNIGHLTSEMLLRGVPHACSGTTLSYDVVLRLPITNSRGGHTPGAIIITDAPIHEQESRLRKLTRLEEILEEIS
jgi:hypothetical protein